MKKKKVRKKKVKRENPSHIGTIMTKAKTHKNEDLKLYSRKRRKMEDRKELEHD